MGFGGAAYELLLCQILALGTWASDVTSLSLSFGSLTTGGCCDGKMK